MPWRDGIQVHPAAALFPAMSDSEIKELGADIAENGQRVGVILWTPEKAEEVKPRKGPETLYLLDGRNRLDAIEHAFDDPDDRDAAIASALSFDWRDGGSAQLIYGDENPYDVVVSANIRRRHLTAEGKREIIRALKDSSPSLSTRAIAKATGIPRATVFRALGHESDVPNGTPDPTASSEAPPAPAISAESTTRPRVTGTDGKSYPAEKTGEVVKFDKKKTEAAKARALDREVNKLIRAWDSVSDEAHAAFLRWVNDPVIDNTKAGRK